MRQTRIDKTRYNGSRPLTGADHNTYTYMVELCLCLALDGEFDTRMSVDERGCRLGTKQGVLQPLYVRSMFDLCKTNGFISVSDVPVEKIISLREAATNESVGSGQGFVRCNCKKEACVSNRCLCRAQGRLCNSKCHKSTACCNK